LAPLRRQRDRGEADRRRAKPYNIVRDISTHGSGQWLGGGYIVKANPREVFGDVVGIICRQGKTRDERRFYRSSEHRPEGGKMKLLRIAAVAGLTAYGGIFAGAGNAAPAAGLFTGAPTVRTLATPTPKASVEKTHYYRRYHRHRRHYWHRHHYWHRRHYWHPYYRHYYRRHYWHPYYW
jgi:hypothetical protein